MLIVKVKNLYGTLIFLFSRVALDDNMHFQILELEGLPIVTNNGLYLEKLLSTSQDVTGAYLKQVKSLASSSSSLLSNSSSLPQRMSKIVHSVEIHDFVEAHVVILH